MLHHHLKTLTQLEKEYEEKLIKEFPNNIFKFMTEDEKVEVWRYTITPIGMELFKQYETLRNELIFKYKGMLLSSIKK